MKLLKSIFFITILCNIANTQSISIGYGPIFTHTNQKVKMVNSEEDFQNTDDQFLINYEHFIKNTKFSVLGSYSSFNGHTWIKFREGSVIAPDGFPVIGDGFSGVTLHRLDFGLSYNFIPENFIFYLKPSLLIGIQKSIPEDVEIYSELFKIDGPEYFELEPISAKKFNTTQIVPSLGLKTGITLWKHIDLGLTIQGVLGFKSFQNMYFKYTYKGVPQETAVFEAKGTGIYTAFSIGYRFIKHKVK
ncbi:MAG TPA: hypothetical protein PK047_13000 [Saprospiraceae bacterium]|nr:hypothetical protein [Saprospiraceae bacterium]HRP43031.1 hypothetical protein [Saprospiraceae bacterium]